MVKVINKYKTDLGKFGGAYLEVDIMRPNILGNPFKDGTRKSQVDRFKVYLWEEIQKGKSSKVYVDLLSILDWMQEYGKEYELSCDVFLVCCCKPKACHGDIIKSALIWMCNETLKEVQT